MWFLEMKISIDMSNHYIIQTKVNYGHENNSNRHGPNLLKRVSVLNF